MGGFDGAVGLTKKAVGCVLVKVNSPALSKDKFLFARVAGFAVISVVLIVLVKENLIDLFISSSCC